MRLLKPILTLALFFCGAPALAGPLPALPIGFIQDVAGTATTIPGPNCINTSLLALGLISGPPRYVHDGEAAHWIETACRPISNALPGDLGVIGSLQNRILHTFIVLSES